MEKIILSCYSEYDLLMEALETLQDSYERRIKVYTSEGYDDLEFEKNKLISISKMIEKLDY